MTTEMLSITRHRRHAGFTLPELLVALVVAAILAAIALPTYVESLRKARRADALSRLAQLQQAQERWRANNPGYADALTDLGIAPTVAGGHYRLSVANVSDTGYDAIASVLETSPQAGDRRCATLVWRQRGANLTQIARNADGDEASGLASPCWMH